MFEKVDTLLQNIFLVLYKKGLTYEMLSDNTESYKCIPLVIQFFSEFQQFAEAGFITEMLSIKFLMRINFSIGYTGIFYIPSGLGQPDLII